MARDAVVVGAGPNGLSAAVALAREGLSVLVVERAERIGGGTRSEALTLPGFVHDVCSAVHPMGAGSPFFASLPLRDHGLEWIHSRAPLAHPLGDGRVAVLERDPVDTAAGLGPDGASWAGLVGPFVDRWNDLARDALGPPRMPRSPLLMLRLALRGLRSAEGLARARLEGDPARALFAGLAAHSGLPLDRAPSAAIGLMLAVAGHAVGWPVARGGSQRIADALASYLRSLGGTVETGVDVRSLRDLPDARAILLDLAPRGVLALRDTGLPAGYRRALARFRHGPGVFKVDWALEGPIPWTAPGCGEAATVHLGGVQTEVHAAEAAPWAGRVAERPFVLLAQPSLIDPDRAPGGKHTAWAYCRVPHGWEGDATGAIEARVERFAPGFRDRILGRSALGPGALQQRNPNLVGGDISGGVPDLRQQFLRPVASHRPYRTPVEGLYLCSASTPPGGGVHGMCGYHAARAAIRDLFA